MSDEMINKMVDRFLSWPLPADFSPDCGIVFERSHGALDDGGVFIKKDREYRGPWWPTGTNLFHAGQARAMIEHMLADTPNKEKK